MSWSHTVQLQQHDKHRAQNKKLQKDENNMIAASWPFYQMMDGLATTRGAVENQGLSDQLRGTNKRRV